ncbi:MAG: STAS domain-containing protein [Sphingobium sp.]|nr:STAS domain-containing protein [Sphingobium sp.]
MKEAFTPALLSSLRNGYSLSQFRDDAIAGLTVAIVALPLAMALGIASGASPDKGLVTAIVAGFLISALGGSRVQIGGPTGAFVVVISGIIAQHGYSGLVLATAMAGVILIIAGYAGVGRLMKYIPTPVVIGFTTGIAVIIASSQIADFLGLKTEHVPAEFFGKWAAYINAIGTTNIAAMAIGLGALAIILILKKVAPRWPGYLIALTAAAVAALALKLPVETVGLRFPDMPTALPAPHIPAFTWQMLVDVSGPAFTIAFLAGIEALLSATVADGMTGQRHRPGQELVGQGAANIASALFGGLPATGAIARTATNIRAGGKTPMSGIFHAFFLLLMLLIAGPLIAYIPMAALAAVLLIVAWGMSEIDRFHALLRQNAGERLLLLLTFGLTVVVDLTVAIGVGVTLASLLFMARMSESAGIIGDEVQEEDLTQRADLPEGVEVFRLAGPLFFGVAGEMLDALTRIGRTPKVVILRLSRVPYIDSSGISALSSFVKQAEKAGARTLLCEVRPAVASELARARPVFAGADHVGSFHAALEQAATEVATETAPIQ